MHGSGVGGACSERDSSQVSVFLLSNVVKTYYNNTCSQCKCSKPICTRFPCRIGIPTFMLSLEGLTAPCGSCLMSMLNSVELLAGFAIASLPSCLFDAGLNAHSSSSLMAYRVPKAMPQATPAPL